MKNKVVGYLIIIITILIGFILFSFNRSAGSTLVNSCTAGPDCSMQKIIDFQANVINGLLIFFVIVGAYLIFFSREERVVHKLFRVKEQFRPLKISKESYKKIIRGLNEDEKSIFEEIINAKGSIMQSELVEKAKMTKVRVTRILDRLEGKGFIERKRRGMTNVVLLKHRN